MVSRSAPHRSINVYESREFLYLTAPVGDTGCYDVLEIRRPLVESEELLIHQLPQQPTETQLQSLIQSRRLSLLHQDVRLFFGIVKLIASYYLVLVSKAAVIATLHEHEIFTIKDIALMPAIYRLRCTYDETRYKNIFLDAHLDQCFYFSYSYDLTSTLQTNVQRADHEDKHSTSDNEGSNLIRPDARSEYIWNYYAIKNIINAAVLCKQQQQQQQVDSIAADEQVDCLAAFIMPVIHGSLQQRRFRLVGGSEIIFTLIARRCRYFAGTRYLRRGVNVEGYTANEIESEQIITLFHAIQCYCRSTAVVQIRGSIPLPWSHPNFYVPNPNIQIEDDADPDHRMMELHFNRLFSLYGRNIYMLDLLRQADSKREVLLGRSFREVFASIQQQLQDAESVHHSSSAPDNFSAGIDYIPFDLHQCAEEMNGNTEYVFAALSSIDQQLLSKIGFFLQPAADYTGMYLSFPVPYSFDELFDRYQPVNIPERGSKRLINYDAHKEGEQSSTENAALSSHVRLGAHAQSWLEFKSPERKYSWQRLKSQGAADDMVVPMDDLNAGHDLLVNQKTAADNGGLEMKVINGASSGDDDSVPASEGDEEVLNMTFFRKLTPDRPYSLQRSIFGVDTQTPAVDEMPESSHAADDCTGLEHIPDADLRVSPSVLLEEESHLPTKSGLKMSEEPVTNAIGRGLPVGLLQHGVLRSNCMDCLDRTNIAQFIYAKCVLDLQLQALGIELSPHSRYAFQMMAMKEWAQHGDVIAKQYGGSEAMHRIDGKESSSQRESRLSGNYSYTSEISTVASQNPHQPPQEKVTSSEVEKNTTDVTAPSPPLVQASPFFSMPTFSNTFASNSITINDSEKVILSSPTNREQQSPAVEFSLSGGARNTLVAVRRFYSNITTDFQRQQSIDLLLGVFIPKRGSKHIWDTEQRPEKLRHEPLSLTLPATVDGALDEELNACINKKLSLIMNVVTRKHLFHISGNSTAHSGQQAAGSIGGYRLQNRNRISAVKGMNSESAESLTVLSSIIEASSLSTSQTEPLEFLAHPLVMACGRLEVLSDDSVREASGIKTDTVDPWDQPLENNLLLWGWQQLGNGSSAEYSQNLHHENMLRNITNRASDFNEYLSKHRRALLRDLEVLESNDQEKIDFYEDHIIRHMCLPLQDSRRSSDLDVTDIEGSSSRSEIDISAAPRLDNKSPKKEDEISAWVAANRGTEELANFRKFAASEDSDSDMDDINTAESSNTLSVSYAMSTVAMFFGRFSTAPIADTAAPAATASRADSLTEGAVELQLKVTSSAPAGSSEGGDSEKSVKTDASEDLQTVDNQVPIVGEVSVQEETSNPSEVEESSLPSAPAATPLSKWFFG